MATHKGIQLTSMSVGRLCGGVSSIPHQEWGVRWCVVITLVYRITPLICNYFLTVEGVVCDIIWQHMMAAVTSYLR